MKNEQEHRPINNIYLNLIRILLGLIFITSGGLKIIDLVSFQDALIRFDLIPISMVNFTTMVIPSLELVSGLFLLLGIFKRGAVSILVFLLIGFTYAVFLKYINGDQFDCGCFGSLAILNSISLSKVVFSLFLIFFSLMVFRAANKEIDLFDQLKVTLSFSIMLTFILAGPFTKNEILSAVYGDTITKIDFKKATELITNKQAILLDARDFKKYQEEHIYGAIPLPYNSFNRYFREYNDITKDKVILVYCDGSLCTAADRVAKKIIKRGYRNVFVISENFRD